MTASAPTSEPLAGVDEGMNLSARAENEEAPTQVGTHGPWNLPPGCGPRGLARTPATSVSLYGTRDSPSHTAGVRCSGNVLRRGERFWQVHTARGDRGGVRFESRRRHEA